MDDSFVNGVDVITRSGSLMTLRKWLPPFTNIRRPCDVSGHISIELMAALIIVSLSMGSMIELAGVLGAHGKVFRERSNDMAYVSSIIEMAPWGMLEVSNHSQFIRTCHSIHGMKEVLWFVEIPRSHRWVASCQKPGAYPFKFSRSW